MLIEKVQELPLFEDFLKEKECYAEEGLIVANSHKKTATHLQNIPFLPADAINEDSIIYHKLTTFQWEKVTNRKDF